MKKLLVLVAVIVSMLATASPVGAHTEGAPFVTDLIAGQHEDAGDVLVWNDSANLHVKYVTDDVWSLAQTNLYVANSLSAIPQKNGNPIPGKFKPYSTKHDPYVEEYEYIIPRTWSVGTSLYIAAHAVVVKSCGTTAASLAEFCASLPATATMNYRLNMMTAYFTTTISGDGSLNGIYEGWCFDLDNTYLVGQDLNVKVLCSYNPLAASYVNFPGNLDLVNWILNEDFRGKTAPDGSTYTWFDVQIALWRLLEDPSFVHPNPADWTEARVNSIIASAQANGEGFTPGSDDVIVIILVPVNAAGEVIAQISAITVDYPSVPVYCDETAWGDGLDFSGDNWAMYFNYTVQ